MHSNLEKFGSILKQEGTSRSERALPALDPASVPLDDRKLQDFIVYAQQYAKNLLFMDADSTDIDLKESWASFFRNDNIVLLTASIAGRNVEELHTTYDLLASRFREEPGPGAFSELVEFVLSKFKKISDWYYATPAGSSLQADLALYIYSYLQKEMEGLKEIVLYVRNLGQREYSQQRFLQEFYGKADPAQVKSFLQQDDIWEIPPRENIALREQLFAGSNEEEKLYNASLSLDKMFDAVFHATENVVQNSKRYFEEIVEQKQNHPPHITFLITFIKLFGYVQEEMNQLPRRHLEYYYQDVLRIKPKEAVPDEAYVVFELAKGFDGYPLKQGTLLTAGKDKKNADLFYTVNDDLVINRGQVASLQTVFIERDRHNQSLNYYRQPLGGSRPDADASYRPFGEAAPAQVAEIGFGIASTQFYLAKGERDVVIRFRIQDEPAVEQFDTALLKLLLSGEKGWLGSDDPKSGITIRSLQKTSSRQLELHFTISIAQESAIVAFDPKIHAGNFQTAFPVLQCILKFPVRKPAEGEEAVAKWQQAILQLNTLQNLSITGTSIRVQVGSIQPQVSFDGIKDLLLENADAPLDPKKPFYPFTSIPKVGTSFYVGCKDLFYKKIQRMSVNLEWVLPDDFGAYYAKYTPPYDANKFIASLSVLEGKFWRKLDDIYVIDKDASDPRFKSVRIEFDKLKAGPVNDPQPSGVLAFDNDRKDGTLRLKLKYPDFGHGIYPQLITSAVMEKAASKTSAVDYHKIVKKQLDDSVISIKLPPDADQRNGSLSILYDILERVKDNTQAQTMIVRSLGTKIEEYNGSTAVMKKAGTPITTPPAGDKDPEARVLVNDDNLVERVLRFLKKVKIIKRRIHYDEDKQNADEVVDAVKDRINTRADFIMPGDRELVNVIMSETNNAIRTTVSHAVEEILEMRGTMNPEPVAVAALLKKEFDEANEVINDMIARKIAILLSANEIPPPPYTPLVNAISLSYASEQDSLAGGDQFYHLTPLGVMQIVLLQQYEQMPSASVFPRSLVVNQDTKGQFQGLMFIGLQNVKPPQNITMLLRIAEGTKQNDKKPPVLHWWYLKNDRWQKLREENLVSDTTYGFQTTGITEVSLPADAGNESVIFETPGLHWLCAAVSTDTDAFPRLHDIRTQAVAVTFHNQNNDLSRLAVPLEAGRINGFADTIPQIKKASQPLASAGGQVQETGKDYYTRTSERLRHKNRAVTNWDYERLVLENFPFLFKVKCLNNYYQGRFAVGHVTVVPIASLTNRSYDGDQLLIPRTGYIDLLRIEQFLAARINPFVKVHALNPELNYVLIHCKVKFHTGVDQGYYLQELNRELIRFLTPWVEGETGGVSFSAKIYSSSIVNFTEQCGYVDYVTDLVMEQYTENDRGEKDFCTEADELTSLVETQITSGHSILVSAPAHLIELVV